MPWHAHLQLDYRREGARTVVRHAHNGPLRILKSLYPEGDAICHNVLVHPPSGLVGGDTLDIRAQVASGAHALITTPGATRFYRSTGELALQRTHAVLDAGARLEWLPLEAIAYSDCQAENRLTLELAPGAEFLGWDTTALGLPHADQPFAAGRFVQHIDVPGVWLERGNIAATDDLLLNSPLGLAGQRCMASLFFVAGTALDRQRRARGLELARDMLASHSLCGTAGATCPNSQVMVVRVLAPLVEPAVQLLRQVWLGWRAHFWQLSAVAPRIWST